MKQSNIAKYTVCAVLGGCILSNTIGQNPTHAFAEDVAIYSNVSSTSDGVSYRVYTKQPANGSISATPVMRPAGGLVTVVASPDEGYEIATISAVTEKKLPVYLVATGENTYQFEQPESAVTVTVEFQPVGGYFSVDNLEDVDYYDWFYLFVKDMVDRGVMLGTSTQYFEPYANTTRGAMAVIIANIHKVDTSTITENVFSDVTSTSWYRGAANWCVRNGILYGSEWTLFEGDRDITREELIQALFYYAKIAGHYTHVYTTSNLNNYKDTYAISTDCMDAMSWAVQMEFIKGDLDGFLFPKSTATRAEICAILSRFLTSHDYYTYYGTSRT